MKKLHILIILLVALLFTYDNVNSEVSSIDNISVLSDVSEQKYWLVLHRKSNLEILFLGTPGDKEKSQIIKTFTVKSGVPGEKPTPLPELLGKEYWLITDKWESKDNPETAPYFLKLDVPTKETEPFGPTPYLECGKQCNWELPGYFGLHGVNANNDRLSNNDPGSSGCIRHTDEDITFLYNLLDPTDEAVRYYIENT